MHADPARTSSCTPATRSTPTARSPREVVEPDGQVWRNLVTEEVSKVAETLDEFRGRHRYNLLDDERPRAQRRRAR